MHDFTYFHRYCTRFDFWKCCTHDCEDIEPRDCCYFAALSKLQETLQTYVSANSRLFAFSFIHRYWQRLKLRWMRSVYIWITSIIIEQTSSEAVLHKKFSRRRHISDTLFLLPLDWFCFGFTGLEAVKSSVVYKLLSNYCLTRRKWFSYSFGIIHRFWTRYGLEAISLLGSDCRQDQEREWERENAMVMLLEVSTTDKVVCWQPTVFSECFIYL